MSRPREFDREVALKDAMNVFWAKGYAATSTDDLLQAMGIGRQSLYNAFGGKRELYREALDAYQRDSTAGHLKRLNVPDSPVAGIRDLLLGVIARNDEQRALGCMGVCSVSEFGVSDPELQKRRNQIGFRIHEQLVARLREGQQNGEIDPNMLPKEAASFILLTMTGIQLAARGGAGNEELRRMALFAVDRLRVR